VLAVLVGDAVPSRSHRSTRTASALVMERDAPVGRHAVVRAGAELAPAFREAGRCPRAETPAHVEGSSERRRPPRVGPTSQIRPTQQPDVERDAGRAQPSIGRVSSASGPSERRPFGDQRRIAGQGGADEGDWSRGAFVFGR
jgi:hypothetical protein